LRKLTLSAATAAKLTAQNPRYVAARALFTVLKSGKSRAATAMDITPPPKPRSIEIVISKECAATLVRKSFEKVNGPSRT
jgi:hypothetical protein